MRIFMKDNAADNSFNEVQNMDFHRLLSCRVLPDTHIVSGLDDRVGKRTNSNNGLRRNKENPYFT